jgi:hypothetical protein
VGAATRGDPLDYAQDPVSPETDAPSADSPPPGLRAQLAAVWGAVRRLLGAHLELARAEAGEIGAEIRRVALLAGLAFGALFVLGMLLPIGLLLFLGDLLFGSIGWGVAIGTFALIDVAVLAVLVALGIRRGPLGGAFLVAVLIGAVVGLLLSLTRAFGLPPLVAIGITLGLLAWPIAAGYLAARAGIDTEALKARFYPSQTIETTKETIEWVRARTPLGPRS